MAGHAQLKFIMTECSKTQIRGSYLAGNSYPTTVLIIDYCHGLLNILTNVFWIITTIFWMSVFSFFLFLIFYNYLKEEMKLKICGLFLSGFLVTRLINANIPNA